MKKTLLTLLVDTVVGTALLVAGFALQEQFHAPVWSMALFMAPFLVYVLLRMKSDSRSILVLLAVAMVTTTVCVTFLPREYQWVAGGLGAIVGSQTVKALRKKAHTPPDGVV